jgi:uncharacterized membrane protein YvlD (DUF360 family)
MDSQMFRLSVRNLANGLIVAVGSAVILTIQAWLTNPNFDIMSFGVADGKILLSVALSAGLSYLAKKLFSNEEGKFLGKI